jgi:acetylornithine/succinyldiaminopimelate/putrescine aminotransferase
MQDLRWPTYAIRDLVLDGVVPGRDPEGRGSMYLRDTAGNEYLDGVGGIGCLPLGHAHPKWVAAIAEQAGRLAVAAATFPSLPMRGFVSKLLERSVIPDGRVFLGNTGTESNEAAIKLALRATGRDVILGFERAFHGRTLGSIALTATAAYRDPYVSCLGEPEDRFARMNVARAVFNDLDSVREKLERYRGRVAAVFVEPVQGEGGIHPADREFLLGLRQLCNEHGALLGTDEIQCGSGRTGNWDAWTTIVGADPETAPDVTWYAKALGGGFPVAACVAKASLAEHMAKGSHGSTFGGNPLASAAGLVTLQLMDEEGLLASAARQVPTMQKIVAADPHPKVAQVRGLGAMVGIEIEGDGEPAAPLGGLVEAEGLFITICKGKTIRLLLPFRADEKVLAEAWGKIRRGLDKL